MSAAVAVPDVLASPRVEIARVRAARVGGEPQGVVAPAAALIDNSDGFARRRLPSVPPQAGPVPVRGPAHPLALGRDARARLGGAVRALLDVPGLEDASDAVRLAVVVLASRTPSSSGVVEIRTPELGRWLGLSASYTASDVVPVLRRSGVVSVEVAEGEYGQDDGLKCRVLPLWAAQDVAGHPLNLAKKEYATLLRLLEAVMAPGWTHRDGRVTPAGLIGTRTGRGAATDRLALLLLVLEARETGRVRQCGGTVDTKRGRAAATVAGLLGCTASAGERVLERLEDRELVLRVRLRTGSGLANRSRLTVPAVAAAHGRTVAEDVQEDRAEALKPEFSDPDVAARPSEAPDPETEPQVSGVPVTHEADVAEPDVAAALHTDHPHPVAPVSSPALSGGFSGEGRGGCGDLPDRACVREDGPLRGEQQEKSPVSEGENGGRGPVASAPVRVMDGEGQGRQQRGRVPLPPEDLRAVLAPVDLVWARLERPAARRLVEAAARRELKRVVGFAGHVDAPQVLADRLARHLETQMRVGGTIKDPVGWLIGLALPQRQQCGDVRCDDRIRLDTGGECDNCGNVVHLRRARRARIAAQIDHELPGRGERERRQVLEERLRQAATRDAEDFAWRREQARTEQARRDAESAAAEERAKQEHAAAAAAEAARQALPCEDCDQEHAAGLCEACGYRRRTEALIMEAGLVAAAWSADLDNAVDVAAVIAQVRACLEADIATARRKFMELMDPAQQDANRQATKAAFAFTALQAIEQAAPEYRWRALTMLARGQEAGAEARRAYVTEQNRRWFRANPNGADAVAAATKAADAARERTAQHLLATRLEQLRKQTGPRTETPPGPAPWADRLTELAARPLEGDQSTAVIA